MDATEWREAITRAATQARELFETLSLERDWRHGAGEDTTWMDQILPELEQLAAGTHDVEIVEAIRLVLERHGPGPYLDEDLAVLAGVDLESLRRVREQLVAAGIARPADEL